MPDSNFFTLFSFILGACLGSFANVIIVRWPLEESIISPRSKCRSCNKQILNIDNIPILSWIFLLGKCRFCKNKIGIQYPLVELVMGFLFCVIYIKEGFSIQAIEYFVFVFGLVTISVIDLKHFLIPDMISIPGIFLGLLGALINPNRLFLDSLIGIVLGGGFFWITGYLYYKVKKEHGLGGGDVKLVAWIGAVLGWGSLPFVILFSSIIGTIFGIWVIFKTKGGIKTMLPFGPFLSLATIVYIILGHKITALYFKLFFPQV